MKGELKLPSEKAMRADIEVCKRRSLSRFKPPFDGSHSGLVMCDGVAYTDELAALMGCSPPMCMCGFCDLSNKKYQLQLTNKTFLQQ